MRTPLPVSNAAAPQGLRALLQVAQYHLERNRLLEAAKGYFEAVRLQPDCFEAHCQLGVILRQLQQPEEALSCLQVAGRLNPNFPKLHALQAAILRDLQRFEEAVACCQREIQVSPHDPDAHYNLGLMLQNVDRLEEAIGAYQRALELRPGHVDALVNLGAVFRQQLKTDAALRCFKEAVRCAPQNPEPHWELCTVLLALGQFERGWQQYEWRWRQKDFHSPPARFAQPEWDGSDLRGRRILLHCEQGYGDTIQFARYTSLVAARGGEVIFGCPKPLSSLIGTVPGVGEVVTNRGALPSFDVHAPVMSLPRILGTTLETVPAAIPYLRPPRRSVWSPKQAERSLKIGLAWAGDPRHRNDRRRSLSLDRFRPLINQKGTSWYSLQVGKLSAEITRRGLERVLPDWGSRFQDFGDTADAVAELDLVIAVDTAVAHLAGALGKPVWTLLPFEAEWRWMIGREDSPWYPTMRLFRQSSPGDWDEVLKRVGLELEILTGK